MKSYRIFVEKYPEFRVEAARFEAEWAGRFVK